MHFKIFEPSPFSKYWYSHKCKRAGLTYEIGLNVHTADICWAYGEYPAGCNNITLTRRGILSVLPRDKGYKSVPDRIVVPSEDLLWHGVRGQISMSKTGDV